MTLTLGQQMASARNYSYECYMNEYSIDSIKRADRDLAALTQLVLARGEKVEDYIEWSSVLGRWVAKDGK